MKPFLAKGYVKRKLHTGNQSVQFDEEREVERPLFYSSNSKSLHSSIGYKSPVNFERALSLNMLA